MDQREHDNRRDDDAWYIEHRLGGIHEKLWAQECATIGGALLK
jgi:hypothetical protein